VCVNVHEIQEQLTSSEKGYRFFVEKDKRFLDGVDTRLAAVQKALLGGLPVALSN
jgi:hypothetical protein